MKLGEMNESMNFVYRMDDVNKLYKILCKRKETKRLKAKKYIDKNLSLLMSTIFDRNIYFLDSCSIDTLYLIGFSGRLLSQEVTLTLTKKQKLAFSIGRMLGEGKIIGKNEFYIIFNVEFTLTKSICNLDDRKDLWN